MGYSDNYKRGRDAGRNWASTAATPKQRDGIARGSQLLPKFRTVFDAIPEGQDFDFLTGEPLAGEIISFGTAFAQAMLNIEGVDGSPGSFWETAAGDRQKGEDREFVHGFMNGAIRAVKDTVAD